MLGSFGGLYLEYRYLTDLTGDQEYAKQIEDIRSIIQRMHKPNGLYMTELDDSTFQWESKISTLSWPSLSFYQGLIKSYVQSNFRNKKGIAILLLHRNNNRK